MCSADCRRVGKGVTRAAKQLARKQADVVEAESTAALKQLSPRLLLFLSPRFGLNDAVVYAMLEQKAALFGPHTRRPNFALRSSVHVFFFFFLKNGACYVK